MTKLEAIEKFEYALSGECTENFGDFYEEIMIAIECIQHCIDEENTSYPKYVSPELVQDLSDFIDENYSDI